MTDRPRFAFCPYDGSPLDLRPGDEGVLRPICPACRFVDYDNPKPCVGVLIEENGRLLLGRRAVEPAKGMWDILGGFLQAGETAEEAVHREIREETGLHVAITRYLGSFPDTYGTRQDPIITLGFVAVPAGGQLRAASDVAELRWFPATDLPTVLAFPHQPQMIEAWREPASQPRLR